MTTFLHNNGIWIFNSLKLQVSNVSCGPGPFPWTNVQNEDPLCTTHLITWPLLKRRVDSSPIGATRSIYFFQTISQESNRNIRTIPVFHSLHEHFSISHVNFALVYSDATQAHSFLAWCVPVPKNSMLTCKPRTSPTLPTTSRGVIYFIASVETGRPSRDIQKPGYLYNTWRRFSFSLDFSPRVIPNRRVFRVKMKICQLSDFRAFKKEPIFVKTNWNFPIFVEMLGRKQPLRVLLGFILALTLKVENSKMDKCQISVFQPKPAPPRNDPEI